MCYTAGPRCAGSLLTTISTLKRKIERTDDPGEQTSLKAQLADAEDEFNGTPSKLKSLRLNADKLKTKKLRAEAHGYADYCEDAYKQKIARGKALTALIRVENPEAPVKLVSMSNKDRREVLGYLSDESNFTTGFDDRNLSSFSMDDARDAQKVVNDFAMKGNNHVVLQRILAKRLNRMNHHQQGWEWSRSGMSSNKVEKWHAEISMLQTAIHHREDTLDNNPGQYEVTYTDGIGFSGTAHAGNMQEAQAKIEAFGRENPGYDDTTSVSVKRKGESFAHANSDLTLKYDVKNQGNEQGFLFIAE